MLWAALCLAASIAGVAIAAAGLLVRPTRLAVPIHALGMTLAFCAGGYFVYIVSGWAGTGFRAAKSIGGAGFVLALFILPFCVVAARFTSLAQKRPRTIVAVSALILATALVPSIGGSVATVLMLCGISALLVAPTVVVHRLILTIPEANARGRFQAVAGWTLVNAFLVFACGRTFAGPMMMAD